MGNNSGEGKCLYLSHVVMVLLAESQQILLMESHGVIPHVSFTLWIIHNNEKCTQDDFKTFIEKFGVHSGNIGKTYLFDIIHTVLLMRYIPFIVFVKIQLLCDLKVFHPRCVVN